LVQPYFFQRNNRPDPSRFPLLPPWRRARPPHRRAGGGSSQLPSSLPSKSLPRPTPPPLPAPRGHAQRGRLPPLPVHRDHARRGCPTPPTSPSRPRPSPLPGKILSPARAPPARWCCVYILPLNGFLPPLTHLQSHHIFDLEDAGLSAPQSSRR
ncbi:hypothetical protein BRADI_3g11005v3, partial [Brachypodium distachyon]